MAGFPPELNMKIAQWPLRSEMVCLFPQVLLRPLITLLHHIGFSVLPPTQQACLRVAVFAGPSDILIAHFFTTSS